MNCYNETSCTVLHRCDDEVGCCFNRAQRCTAKSSVLVDVHFNVLSVETNRTTVSVLTFTNHTECECQYWNVKDDSLILDQAQRLKTSDEFEVNYNSESSPVTPQSAKDQNSVRNYDTIQALQPKASPDDNCS